MRTVHETEALRPSDPIPKLDPAKASRLKLIIKKSQEEKGGEAQQTNGTTASTSEPVGWTSSFPPELGFTAAEEARGPKELYRLLRRQVHWAEVEAESLKRQCEFMEELRKKDWAEKEVLLDQVIKEDIDHYSKRLQTMAAMKARAGEDSIIGGLPPPDQSASFQSSYVPVDGPHRPSSVASTNPA